MTKRLPIGGAISDIELAPNVHALECFLRKNDIAPLCIDMSLLSFGLIDRISLETDKNQKVAWSISPELAMTTMKRDKSGISVLFCANDFQAIQSFLLHFCRDGFTAVDHIDIELSSNDRTMEYSLVIRTDVFRAPMSSLESRKMLGLD